MGPISRSAISLASALLLANAEPEEDEGTICVTVAHLWRGDARDIGRIRSEPVPESFRRLFEAGGCTRFSLVEQTLIDWHLAFGDERSTARALAYLEADYRRGVPAPEAFGPYLAAAWAAARSTIAGAALPPPGQPGRNEREAVILKSPDVRRAVHAVAGYSRYVELAAAYARAAEVYGSARFLEKAELFFAPVRVGLATLYADGAEPRANLDHMLYAPSHHLDEILDLEMRIPILRARLSRAPDDAEAAATVVRHRYRPVFETAADNAREHSGSVCETHGEAQGRLMALERTCDEESNLPRRVVDFWRNRANLDLLMAANPEHFEPVGRNRSLAGSGFARRPGPVADAEPARRIQSFDTAAWLLRYQRLGDQDDQRSNFDPTNVELFMLLLARSDLHARRAARASDPEETGLALDYAGRAAQLAPPHSAPALFRRAAEAWLNLWSRASKSKEIESWRLGERGRLDAYLRANLESLDSIAVGRPGAATSAP